MAGKRLKTPIDGEPTRSPSMAKTSYRNVRIERARIINVNIRDYTVDARTELPPYKPKFDIPFMVPYCHFNQGEGLNFMPEVGSTCWVCESSEDGREAFVLGWNMPDEKGAYRGGRQLLNPGDIYFSTRDGNFMALRRGGIVQIGSTPACQRVFIPIRNVMQDFAENYELHTPGGDLTWKVDRKENDGDGHQKTTFLIEAHEFSDDPVAGPIASLKIGSHGANDDRIFSLVTLDKGGGSAQVSMSFDKKGNVLWDIKKDIKITIAGDSLMTVIGDASFKGKTLEVEATGGDLAAKASGDASLKGDTTTIKAQGKAKMDGDAVDLGDADAKIIINSSDFKKWVKDVTTALSQNPAVSPTSVKPLAPSLQAPTSHVSSKVKA